MTDSVFVDEENSEKPPPVRDLDNLADRLRGFVKHKDIKGIEVEYTRFDNGVSVNYKNHCYHAMFKIYGHRVADNRAYITGLAPESYSLIREFLEKQGYSAFDYNFHEVTLEEALRN